MNKIAMNRVKLLLVAGIAFAASTLPAAAQNTACAFLAQYGYVPTTAQWTNCLASKQDLLPFTPLSIGGGVLSGRLVILNPTTGQAPLNLLPLASDPTSLANGDVWFTSSAIKAQVGSVTYDLLSPTLTSLNQLPAIGAGTFLGNTGGSSAKPSAVAISTLGANPTATAGPTAVNGSASTYMRSDGAPAVQLGSNSVKGIVQCDGTSINCSSGVISTAASNAIVPPQGRLTLATGVPVMTTTTTGSTVYYTPYLGTWVPIYNGTAFAEVSFAEVSQALSDTTKSPGAATANNLYDVFCWVDGGTNRCTRGPAWSTSTARGTGAGTTELTTVSGLYLNANAITNGPAAQRGTYVGTVVINSGGSVEWTYGSAASGGGYSFLGVWNQYNRVAIATAVIDSGTSYTYTPSTVREARGSSNNFVKIVSGSASTSALISYTQRVDTAAAVGAIASWGAGLDSTTSFIQQRNNCSTPVAAAVTCANSNVVTFNTGLGVHTITANEQSDGTNATTFDAANSATLNMQIMN